MITWIAAASLAIAGISVFSAWRAKRHARRALQAAKLTRKDHAALTEALVTLVDDDGNVHLRALPPSDEDRMLRAGIKLNAPDAILTPCGDMCKLAFWIEKGSSRGWRCKAGQGHPCDDVRPKFVDNEGECVHWERDDDC